MHRTLVLLAALVWHIGGFVLLRKGIVLIIEAEAIKPGLFLPWVTVWLALLLGGLKAFFVFRKSCKKNLDRIAALQQPKIWQFFRPRFFIALGLMITVGATLSHLAQDHYYVLHGVAFMDLGIATALLGSSYVFWQYRA